MNTKLNLKRACISIMAVVFMLGFLTTCDKKGTLKTPSTVIVEQLRPLNEALLPLIDGFTSGAIVKGEPIVVRFKSPETLKVKYGETLPAKAFNFKPALKGKAVWVDENTVGFQYDEIDPNQNYTCDFRIGDFLDFDDAEPLQFGFAVRRQNFSVVGTYPVCVENDKMDYLIRLAFVNPVEGDVAQLVNKEVRKNHTVNVNTIGDNLYEIEIKDLERKDAASELKVTLDGSAVEANKEMSIVLPIYAKGDFMPVKFDVDQTTGKGTLYFSQALKQGQNLIGLVSFNNNVGFKSDIQDNKVAFYFDKTNLYHYQMEDMELVVGTGIRSEAGHVLQEESTFPFALTDYEPKVRWTDEGIIIPNVDETTVYFDAICLNAVTLRIIRIFDDNILSFLQDNELNETYGVRKVGRLEKKVHLQIDNPYPTQWKTFPIKLTDYVKVEPGAMYQLSLDFGPADYTFASDEMKGYSYDNSKKEAAYWDGQGYDYKEYHEEGDWGDPNGYYFYNYVEEKKNIVVSDLAVTAKMGRNDMVDVYVFQISDAQPASGAQVTAYNFQRQELAKGRTDAQGHVQLQCENRPAFVVAQDNKGSKSVIKLTDGNALSYSRFNIEGEPVEKGVSGFAYTNRGVWRPGDEIQINLMLNDFDNLLPDNYPVVLEITDANGRLYAKQVNTKPTNGIYCYSVPTHVSDETGLWTARFKVGNSTVQKSLRVETVKPNRLEIHFDLPEVISLYWPERAALSSKWLNGMKARGLKAEVDVKVRQGQTSFKGFESYSFDNEAESFYSEEIALFSGALNSEGVTDVGFDPLTDLSSQQMMNAVFTTKVFENGGDFSIASYKAVLSPFARYVGVQLPETSSKYGSYYDTNKDWVFNIAVVNENGQLNSATVSLDYALYKLDSYWWWSSEDVYTLQQYASGTYKRPVKNGKLTCNGKTTLTLNIPDKEWGSYLLVVEDEKGGNRFAKIISFDWGESYGHANSTSGAPAQLSLRATADSYQLGEKIVVTFPANDRAKALVTVEANDKVLQTMIMENLSEEGRVEIATTEEMIPNVYVYVALIQPHDAVNGLPIRLYGVIPVKVENKQLQLQPTLVVPETANTKKNIEVKVGEANKQGMTYTLAIVDEGILGLTNFKTANPYAYFNSKQALKVRTWDNYASVVDAFSGELGSVYAIGGDGIINQDIALDNRFKAYAVTLGPFDLKAGETNSHNIEVPQCSGALRFMVVAKGKGKAYGASEKQMKVVDPITLYASASRVVAPGDELTMKVQVLSPTMKGKSLKVSFDNQNLEAVGNLPTTVSIDQNGEGLITLNTRVSETTGNALLKVTVSGEGYSAESATVMPIRLPYAERRNLITEEIEGGQSITIPFELAGIEGSQEGSIMLSSLLPVDLYSRLDYLTSYPHGCLEQLTSKAFPQLYLNYFIQQNEEETAQMRSNIEAAINNLKAYQKSDNSMTNWIGGNYSDPWTEIYALHFLVEAKKQGFNVPQYFYDGLMSYQANRARQWKNNPDYKQGETIQAYRLFVLALGNRPELAPMNRFKEIEMNYSLSKALTAAAFALTGKTTIAQNMMPTETGGRMSDYYTSFGSTIRDLAFLTYTQMLCDMEQQTVQNNINEICAMLNSNRWMDTQTTAFALFVLGKYAEKNNVSNGNLSAIVKINGEEHTLNSNMSSAGIKFTPKLGSNTVEIKSNSDQKLVANLFTKTSVAEYDMTESGNFITMNMSYTDKSGNALNLANLKAGTDIVMQFTVQNPSEWQVTELALSYYLPSGWELVNDRLFGDGSGNEGAKHIDIRDDRVYIYFDLAPNSKKTFTLKANATYEGNYMIPAVRCEDMYNNEIYYQIPARGCVVK